MLVVQEQTQWRESVANNLYLITDSWDHVIAYVPQGEIKATRFKQPMRWDHRGRQFKVLKKITDTKTTDVEVKGSNGQIYRLTQYEGKWQCSCPGFQYRGKCRHVINPQ